ncbi:MAG: beta-galactosidase [Gaiellaceae bacterium]
MTGLLYGGDYNPEQWPEETWIEDAELMREAGVNLVTVAVFSWALLEPERGAYDFGWLDRVIDLLWSRGVAVDLATATASPPAWLVRRYPEILPVTAEGVRLEFGSRQHYCPSSPLFREAALRLCEQVARHYRDHPALAMWHVGNEYGCHVPACYCSVSAGHFRRWLGERYGGIEELNRAWGTAFWGQRYGAWDEIEPPRRMPAFPNPSQALDWWRFCSDAMLECFEAERDLLAELAPDIPVTTNFMGRFKPVDCWAWAGKEDVVTIDSYPDPGDPEAHVRAALDYDVMRSLAEGGPWLLLEHAPSAVNWRPVNVPKRPGLRRLWVHQAVARGSDGAMFFQWRAARAGAEKFHSGMVPHLGAVGRIWQETVDLGRELGKMAEIAGSGSRSGAAFLLDWESWWALEAPAHPSSGLDFQELLFAWYRRFFELNVAVDFAHPSSQLAGYRLVVVPSLYLASDETIASLTEFAEGGGVVVVGPFSGVVDEHDDARCGDETRALRRLLGVRVEEHWPLLPGDRAEVSFDDGESAVVIDWSEWIELEGAEPVARYSAGPLEGRPALVRNSLGSGAVYYCSAGLGSAGIEVLARRALAEAGVEPVVRAPAGVEACRRGSPRGSYLFLLNHNSHDVEVELPASGAVELLSGAVVGGSLPLAALGVAVLREPQSGPGEDD